jgi:hypothetical protein
MQIIGYSRPANTPSHCVTEPQYPLSEVLFKLERGAKTITKLPAIIRFQWNPDKNSNYSNAVSHRVE